MVRLTEANTLPARETLFIEIYRKFEVLNAHRKEGKRISLNSAGFIADSVRKVRAARTKSQKILFCLAVRRILQKKWLVTCTFE